MDPKLLCVLLVILGLVQAGAAKVKVSRPEKIGGAAEVKVSRPADADSGEEQPAKGDAVVKVHFEPDSDSLEEEHFDNGRGHHRHHGEHEGRHESHEKKQKPSTFGLFAKPLFSLLKSVIGNLKI
ncbi:hypothetical protein GDO86_002675 [Hymenochirus boettgeri]|uniref:Uncharacterized protein n=1 Tax=Hymenochirus boettgeri TaxID=247094 RepID=A0A8T2K420_9PIPI|nr:hypothetical protein GDO86_002675 [Hymenochirus boettgeri]